MNEISKFLREKGLNSSLLFQQFLTFLTLLFIFNSCSPYKINKLKNGQKIGCWIMYKDDTHTIFLNKGKYKNGTQVGKWIYNSPDGKKERQEIYRGRKIKIKHFHPNGKVAVKGNARIVVNENKLHFYYYGPWNYYLVDGKLLKIAWFENGIRIKEEYKIKTGSEAIDSLNVELIQLDTDFIKYRDTLRLIANTEGVKSNKYQTLQILAKENDSLIYIRIENIVKRFGYPEKEITGGKNNVIFFIIGFAPWQIKEKYLNVFKVASTKGEIEIRDLAYFEDKYWLGKEGYQIYGTQSKHDNKYDETFYPVKNLSTLNDRRKLMGLEPVNLLKYPEYK